MVHGTHDSLEDDRNREILINVNGELFKRDEAKVSVFDSGFMLGDGANVCPGTPLASFHAMMEAADEYGLGEGKLRH